MIRLNAPSSALAFRMQLIRFAVVCLLLLTAAQFYRSEAPVQADTITVGNPSVAIAAADLPPCDYYASPAGSSHGNGTISNPWSLQTALNKTDVIVTGKTLCLRGGKYSGKFESTLNGGTVRALTDEYPIIDGYLYTTLLENIDSLQTTITV